MQRRELPAGWDRNFPVFPADPKGVAGREASGKVLNALAQNIPWFLGGSADLGPSNKTTLKFEGAGDFQGDTPGGKNLHFGIREHAMTATLSVRSLPPPDRTARLRRLGHRAWRRCARWASRLADVPFALLLSRLIS